MITKEYGYIARVSQEWPKISRYSLIEIPKKAWTVAEWEKYPEVYCIDPKRANHFLDSSTGPSMQKLTHIIFSDEQWKRIVQSFNGIEPEILLHGLGSNLSDLKIKLRVMLDENGRHVTPLECWQSFYAKDLSGVSWSEVWGDKNERNKARIKAEMNQLSPDDWKKLTQKAFCDKMPQIVMRSEWIDNWQYNYDENTLYVSSEYETAAREMIESATQQTKREQMISLLVQKNSAALIERMAEYEERIKQMSDEQIEKEYRMEFGE
jgi:hypothetical protein